MVYDVDDMHVAVADPTRPSGSSTTNFTKVTSSWDFQVNLSVVAAERRYTGVTTAGTGSRLRNSATI